MKINQDDLLKKLTGHIPGMVYQFRLFPDGSSCFPYASIGMNDLLGASPDDVLVDASKIFDCVHPEDLKTLQKSIHDSATTLLDWNCEFRFYHPTDGLRWIKGASRPERLEDGSTIWHGHLNDFTERKQTEAELVHKNALLVTSEKINEMIVHSRSHADIFSTVCEIMTIRGGFRFAWIGLYDSSIESIVPTAFSAIDENYLKDFHAISVKNTSPCVTAFREGRTVINGDTQNNFFYEPWRLGALERGFNSSISLPLIVRGKVIGTFSIYSSETGYFTASEVAVLENITKNMTFAIEILEDRNNLEISELIFRTIFDRAPVGILLVNARTAEIDQVNDRLLEILGYDRKTFPYHKWTEFTHPEDLPKHLDSRKQLTAGEINSFKLTKRYLHADGTYVWVEVLVVPHGKGEDNIEKNLAMVNDVTERMRYEEELRNSIQIKDEFFAIASHELKTPATSLKLQLQILKRNLDPERKIEVDREKLLQGLERSLGQVDRIVGLISNLLDVVKFRNGQLNISPSEIDLSELLKDVINRYEPLFREKGCALNPDVEPGLTGSFDKARIEQVFLNLMDNAAKYAPGMPVDIALKKEGEFPVFIIKDNGPGIENSKLEKIFDRFERLDADRDVGGLGLGLYITKNIVDAHHGKISVKSSPGKGTAFEVRLQRHPNN